MGQEQSYQPQKYVGVGRTAEEAAQNLELVVRATRDDDLRTEVRHIHEPGQSFRDFAKRHRVIYSHSYPERFVPIVFERNMHNKLWIASVVL
jgi:hypothetical protein